MNNLTKEVLAQYLESLLAKYPQYKHYYSGPEWSLCITKKDMRFKSCVIPANTVTLVRWDYNGSTDNFDRWEIVWFGESLGELTAYNCITFKRDDFIILQ